MAVRYKKFTDTSKVSFLCHQCASLCAPQCNIWIRYKLNRVRQLGQLSLMTPFLQGVLHKVVGATWAEWQGSLVYLVLWGYVYTLTSRTNTERQERGMSTMTSVSSSSLFLSIITRSASVILTGHLTHCSLALLMTRQQPVGLPTGLLPSISGSDTYTKVP